MWAGVALAATQAQLAQSLTRPPSSKLLWLHGLQELPAEASLEGAGGGRMHCCRQQTGTRLF